MRNGPQLRLASSINTRPSKGNWDNPFVLNSSLRGKRHTPALCQALARDWDTHPTRKKHGPPAFSLCHFKRSIRCGAFRSWPACFGCDPSSGRGDLLIFLLWLLFLGMVQRAPLGPRLTLKTIELAPALEGPSDMEQCHSSAELRASGLVLWWCETSTLPFFSSGARVG